MDGCRRCGVPHGHGHGLRTIRIFLADGTATVPAQILESTSETLRLQLTLRGGETRDETYRPARVPFVCPDRR